MGASGELTHSLFLALKDDNLEIEFPLCSSNVSLAPGNLNYSAVFEDHHGRLLIARQENAAGRRTELPHVAAEYRGVGFIDNPHNGFRLRNSQEQYKYSASLETMGIKTPHVYISDDQTQWIEFLSRAQDLSAVWLNGDKKAPQKTKLVLEALCSIHQKGISMGDRWGPNELICDDGSIAFVDFDIEIWGPEAIEFELASLLYFISYFAQKYDQRGSQLLLEVYKEFLSEHGVYTYSMPILKRYIQNYFRYFSNDGEYRWDDKSASCQFVSKLLTYVKE